MSISSIRQNWAQTALSGSNDEYVCLVMVVETKGSAPREAGALMFVYKDYLKGSIGGGELEFQAIETARKNQPKKHFARTLRSYPLGPALGQCCGGNVKLMFEWYGPESRPILMQLAKKKGYSQHPTTTQDIPTAASRLSEKMLCVPLNVKNRDVFLYGAGHVGRAVIEIAQHLPCQIYWVDTNDDRYPERIAEGVIKLPAREPQTIAQRAPEHAIHLIMTYSHQLDFDIILAVLQGSNFAKCGLIGSKTKATRFQKRLREAGVSPDVIGRLVCPIGLKEIKGKRPIQVALSVTAQLSGWLDNNLN